MPEVGQEITAQKSPPTELPEDSSTSLQAFSESFFLDSYEAANDGAAGPVFSSLTLAPGRLYRVTVRGTYSAWSYWPRLCGAVEPTPIYPSPGRSNRYVALDAEFLFAAPSNSNCSTWILPRAAKSVEFSLNGGVSWAYVTAATSDFVNHEYTYMVTGQGGPLGVRLRDNPTTDNYGMFKVTVERPDEDHDGVPDDEDLCSHTAASDPAAGVPSMKLGVNHWADLDGDGVFDTVHPRGNGPQLSFTLRDTAGCHCSQIIERLALGQGHTRFGCSISAMQEWTALAAGNP